MGVKRKNPVNLRRLVPASGGGKKNLEGEPTLIVLRRFSNDKTLRGRIITGCCNCGLEHLLTFEVFPEPDQRHQDRWWLTKRSYRITEEDGDA